MNRKKVLYGLLLLLAASIWGMAFVAQRVGMDYVGPFTFSFVRFMIGSVVLVPICIVVVKKAKREKSENKPEERAGIIKNTLVGGIICGIFLCMATSLQQYSIQYTTVGKAGFITALYIILVPIFGVFLGKKITKLVAVSVVIALVGLYFLCIPAGEWVGFTRPDQLILISAVLYAIHILVVAHFAPKGLPVVISAIQFLVAGLLSAVPAFIFETPTWTDIYAGRMSILYAGIMACGVSYTLQVVAQEHVEATTASLILSMEAAVSAISGWIILGQVMNGREISGAAFMFLAMILAQLPARFFARFRKRNREKISIESNVQNVEEIETTIEI